MNAAPLEAIVYLQFLADKGFLVRADRQSGACSQRLADSNRTMRSTGLQKNFCVEAASHRQIGIRARSHPP